MTYKERRDKKRLETLENKIDSIIKKKYNYFFPNTIEWIKNKLRKDLRFHPYTKMIVKEDFIDQFFKSRADNTNIINYDFSLLPEFIKSENEKVIVICLEKTIDGNILGEFETNFKELIIDKKDISQINLRKSLTQEYKISKLS